MEKSIDEYIEKIRMQIIDIKNLSSDGYSGSKCPPSPDEIDHPSPDENDQVSPVEVDHLI